MTEDRRLSRERELGRRIARLRDEAGLTQRELARRVGLTQSALSRIESGQRGLSAGQITQFAQAFAIEPEALLDPEVPVSGGDFGSAHLLMASKEQAWPEGGTDGRVKAARTSRVDGSDAALVFARLNSAGARLSREDLRRAARGALDAGPAGRVGRSAPEPALFAEVVRDAFEVEARTRQETKAHSAAAPKPDAKSSSPFATLSCDMHADPTRLARFWRHELGAGDQGPLPDLVPLVEAAGVDVVHARLDASKPEGACALVALPWVPASPESAATVDAAAVRPFVFVNGFERPVVSQRFALAHGFAHLALGHGQAYDERIDWSGRSRTETAANAFAEEFVAPLAAVRRWFELDADAARSDVDTVVRLANHFGMSFWLARRRAQAAGELSSPAQLRTLDQQLRAHSSQLVRRQLFLGGLRDTLSVLTSESRPGQSRNRLRIAPRGVRVPGRMRAQVTALLESGAVSVEQAAAWLRIDAPTLRYQAEQFENG